MTKHDIKMIAVDLDRTALNNESRLTERTVDAFQNAADKGVTVVIDTGRTFAALPKQVNGMGSVRYFICSNGATIYDAYTGELLMEKCLDPSAVEKMTELVREKNYMFESFTAGKAYIGQDYYDMVCNGTLDYRGRQYVAETRTPVEDIFSFTLDHRDRIENLNVFFDTPEQKEEFRPALEAIPDARLTSSLPSNYELGGCGVSKGAALEYLMDMLGIDRSELLTAGDSPNDIAMLELAGISVAVDNAEPEVKKAALYTFPSNDEDGVAQAIEQLVLAD
ncbi:MAG: HAD family hydrolase [Eubacterium sp.]|nr:HAD family hydrolase [Eubacterium sp.]